MIGRQKKPYRPSPAALDMLEALRGKTPGMTYTELKNRLEVSDTYLSKLLSELQKYEALDHVGKVYAITAEGMTMLSTFRGLKFTEDEWELQREDNDLQRILKEIRKLHLRLYRLAFEEDAKRPFWVMIATNPEWEDKRNGLWIKEIEDNEFGPLTKVLIP